MMAGSSTSPFFEYCKARLSRSAQSSTVTIHDLLFACQYDWLTLYLKEWHADHFNNILHNIMHNDPFCRKYWWWHYELYANKWYWWVIFKEYMFLSIQMITSYLHSFFFFTVIGLVLCVIVISVISVTSGIVCWCYYKKKRNLVMTAVGIEIVVTVCY